MNRIKTGLEVFHQAEEGGNTIYLDIDPCLRQYQPDITQLQGIEFETNPVDGKVGNTSFLHRGYNRATDILVDIGVTQPECHCDNEQHQTGAEHQDPIAGFHGLSCSLMRPKRRSRRLYSSKASASCSRRKSGQ